MKIPKPSHRGGLYRGEKLTAVDCECCGYIHLVPLPRAEEIEARYSGGQFYSQDKPSYRANEERDKEWLEGVCYPTQMAMVKGALKSGGNSLLDVGCGYGAFLEWAWNHHYDVFGLEPSPTMLNPKLPRLIFNKTIDSVDFSFQYDIIRVTWVLEHLLDPRAALKKIYSWLKPGGVLLAIVPNDFSPMQQAVVGAGLAGANYWLHETHINYWNFGSFEQLLWDAGFRVVYKFGAYPMENFLLEGQGYLNDIVIGQICHETRKRSELELVKSDAGREVLMRTGLAMAEVGLGRDMIFVGKKEK